MPVNKPELHPKQQRAYTKQDCLDGKCRPDGTPWGEGEKPVAPVVEEPTQEVEQAPETTTAPAEADVVPANDQNDSPVDEAPAPGQELPEEPLQEDAGDTDGGGQAAAPEGDGGNACEPAQEADQPPRVE